MIRIFRYNRWSVSVLQCDPATRTCINVRTLILTHSVQTQRACGRRSGLFTFSSEIFMGSQNGPPLIFCLILPAASLSGFAEAKRFFLGGRSIRSPQIWVNTAEIIRADEPRLSLSHTFLGLIHAFDQVLPNEAVYSFWRAGEKATREVNVRGQHLCPCFPVAEIGSTRRSCRYCTKCFQVPLNASLPKLI